MKKPELDWDRIEKDPVYAEYLKLFIKVKQLEIEVKALKEKQDIDDNNSFDRDNEIGEHLIKTLKALLNMDKKIEKLEKKGTDENIPDTDNSADHNGLQS